MEKLNRDNRQQYQGRILELLKKGKNEQFRDLFLELHPTDQLDIFAGVELEEKQQIVELLNPAEFGEIFEDLETEQQEEIVKKLKPAYAAEMFNGMSADDVAYFLQDSERTDTAAILRSMDQEEAREVEELLSYEQETAGSIMTKEFIKISAEEQVRSVIERLRKETPDAETIYYLYVENKVGELVGVVSLRDIIIAPDHERIENIMSTRVVSVRVDEDQEDVANLIMKYDFLAAPVVDQQGKLVGIITVDDVMDILEEEATEDLGEISATKGATDLSITSFGAAKKRAPWIVLLMFLGLITAEVIGQFEETLEAIVLLAVFIPLIMDSAGNTGTQSLAVAVRGLALGTIERRNIGKMVKREFGTGVMLGLICMVVLGITIPIFYGSWMLAVIVGFSIFCTLSVATVIGSTVPLLINKLKLDPAIASGPFITTVNDVLGLLIYFSIATALLDFL